MAYTPTDWSDGVTIVDEAHLDHLEGGVATADANATAALAALPGKEDKSAKGAVSGYAPLGADQKVPAANLPAVALNDLSFDGDWVAGTYQEGDVVVKDGVSFLCVGGPTTVAPDPTLWGGLSPTIPTVQNGKWLKGVGGAMVWSDIDSDDIKTGRLKTDGQLVTDWNTALSDGFYRASNTAANAPVADYCQGIVAQYDTGQVVQEVWALFQQAGGLPAIRYQRRMYSGAWGPWIAIGGVTYNTSLPLGVPVDGQECILVDSLTAPTYAWRFRYNAGISDANKWVFIGGSDWYSLISTGEVTGSATYTALTTAGPNFTVPRPGIYTVAYGCNISRSGGNTSSWAFMSIDVGANAAADSDAGIGLFLAGSDGVQGTAVATRQKTLVAGGLSIQSKYRSNGWNATFRDRWMTVIPVRVA